MMKEKMHEKKSNFTIYLKVEIFDAYDSDIRTEVFDLLKEPTRAEIFLSELKRFIGKKRIYIEFNTPRKRLQIWVAEKDGKASVLCYCDDVWYRGDYQRLMNFLNDLERILREEISRG